MAYKATLNVEGTDYDVLSCSYAFSRNTDHKGKPVSDTSGGIISLTLESTEETKLLETMLNTPEKPLKCTVDFQQSESTASLKKLELSDSFIIAYSESFSDGSPMMLSISISAKDIKLGTAQLVNDWPKAKS